MEELLEPEEREHECGHQRRQPDDHRSGDPRPHPVDFQPVGEDVGEEQRDERRDERRGADGAVAQPPQLHREERLQDGEDDREDHDGHDEGGEVEVDAVEHDRRHDQPDRVRSNGDERADEEPDHPARPYRNRTGGIT